MDKTDGFYVDHDAHGKALTGKYSVKNGFVFERMDDAKTWDAIVVRVPQNADSWLPKTGFSDKTLEEHIAYINEKKLTKAVVIAEDLSFLVQCPTLTALQVIPPDEMEGDLEYSPLYALPHLKTLLCRSSRTSTGIPAGSVYYDRIPGLEDLRIEDSPRDKGYAHCVSLKRLVLQGLRKCEDLSACFCAEGLREFHLTQGRMRTLNGLGRSKALEKFSVSYCRALSDISGLAEVAETLQFLEIDSCGKIEDFSVLEKLHNLRELVLIGKNSLPSLRFLQNMPHLWRLIVNMNVLDGDLSLCKDVDYVYVYPDRRHYNMKDEDLPKKWGKIHDDH